MLLEAFKITHVPMNLLKIIINDQETHEKLQTIIQNNIKVSKEIEPHQVEYEIVINKELMNAKPRSDNDEDSDKQPSTPSDRKESFGEKYVAYKILAEAVKFKNSSCVLITFHSINSLKNIQRLINSHVKLIGHNISTNQKRMELLHQTLRLNEDLELADVVGEFLGSHQVINNMVSQMNHFFNHISHCKEKKLETYGLSEEIDFCLDGLTASKWEKDVEVQVNKGELPRRVEGDL